jgi:hypothetical protein
MRSASRLLLFLIAGIIIGLSNAQTSYMWTKLPSARAFDCFVINPVDAKIIYEGHDSGLSKLIDGGVTWTNSEFLNSDETSALIINPRGRDILYAGVCIIGNVGSEKKTNYTAIGDAVNLASRLEGVNKRYGTTIVISHYTHESRWTVSPA